MDLLLKILSKEKLSAFARNSFMKVLNLCRFKDGITLDFWFLNLKLTQWTDYC